MKKILSILICAVLMVALFVVPFSASAEEDLTGTWVFNDDIQLPTPAGTKYYISFESNGQVFDAIYNSANAQLAFKIPGGTTSVRPYTTDSGWTEENKTIIVKNQPSDDYIKSWLKANAIKTHNLDGSEYVSICDGTCAVPDDNLDGICEDCGLPFSLRNTGYEYNHSVSFNTANGVIRAEYMSNEPFTIRGYKYGTSYRVEPSIDVYCMTYLDDELTYQGLVAMHYPSYNLDDTVLSSTFDWYTSSDSGEIFFPLPLWVMVEKVTQGEMIPFSNQTVGNLMTLTLCGVGLITLLVGLYLLLRMLRTYLKT